MSHWIIRSEKLCEGNLSTSLLEEVTCSDAARSSSSDIDTSDCENRAKREIGIRLFGNGLVVLGLATSHCRKITWKRGRYVDERPHRYHRQLMSVFV